MKLKIALKMLSIGVLCFGLAISTKAQDSTKMAQVTSLTKIKVYLVGVGVEREQKIDKKSTIYLSFTIESVVPYKPKLPPNASDALKIDWSINFAPIVSLGYRYYYNFSDREKKAKITRNNSASYGGVEYSLITPMLIDNNYSTSYASSFSPYWGFQKNISKRMNLEFAIGPSFQTNFKSTRMSGFTRFGFNFLI